MKITSANHRRAGKLMGIDPKYLASEMVCSARIRRTGERCTRNAMKPWGLCKLHLYWSSSPLGRKLIRALKAEGAA